jgi:7-cyano-7-deazaguanine synthase in queuosine biosynthesis
VGSLLHLEDRVKDLVEIASYVYCGDRLRSRGASDQPFFDRWSRDLHFVITVRDIDFWNRVEVKSALSSSLTAMTGDETINFTFQKIRFDEPAGLFDQEDFVLEPSKPTHIALFSGGLDSLTGALELLTQDDHDVCLVTHESMQPRIHQTQNALVEELQKRYPGRVKQYRYQCHLANAPSREESQRSRMFLFSSVAVAVASIFGNDSLMCYENGITASNLPLRQDMMNGRSSRTVHPFVLKKLATLFALITERKFTLINPFFWNTRGELLKKLDASNARDLISNTISCGRNRNLPAGSNQCGVCSQCLDRRFAAYSVGREVEDEATRYACEMISTEIEDEGARGLIVDTLSRARTIIQQSDDAFVEDYLSDLSAIAEGLKPISRVDSIGQVAQLYRRYAGEILEGVRRMRDSHDDPAKSIAPNSLLDIVGKREYLLEPKRRLAERIAKQLFKAVPLAFQSRRPAHENELNDVIESHLSTTRIQFEREFPALAVGRSTIIPDHISSDKRIIVEAKIARKGRGIAHVRDEIAADITNYPSDSFKLFVVLDAERAIKNDSSFVQHFEQMPNTIVLIVR